MRRLFPLLGLAVLAFPALAQSPTVLPDNPTTTALWSQPPFGADPASLKQAFAATCGIYARRSPDTHVGGNPQFGTYGQWQQLCRQALALPPEQLEAFLTTNLAPLPLEGTGKLTGYYKPVIEGSRTRHGPYQTPILAKPADLTQCRGATGQSLPNGSCTTPYPTRKQIEANLNHYKVLLWLKDPLDAYFLHIQGSGLVELAEGGTASLNFAAKNGHPYVAIGKVLRDRGELTGDITADKIRAWLKAHPAQRTEVLQQNPSFIFFAENPALVRGAFGVPLTSGRSLAVDTTHIPLGLPLLVSTTTTHDSKPWHRLMFAQDTGSAITGPQRGDIYFGLGPYAGDYAGDQNAAGTIQVLVPKPQDTAASTPHVDDATG
jgi:membrane-bound lytic murein transglycosylase A